ncbi:hypothetical protein QTP86_016821 [Hemibagrus guttatus]|nr:hypothetical protein QTP86_016821 [Hemibagrus guttatus]
MSFSLTPTSPFFLCLRYHYPIPKVFYVQLMVGSNEFYGEGRTRQAARHNAAMKALQALRNEPIPEKQLQDMYERSRTVVRCAVGQTEEFNVEVGLHQGSALSPFLFAIVMDQLSEEVRQESPWTMMFADDIVICSESREQVEENLERWRFALERRGMKVSRSKTEYMCVNGREGSGTVRLQGEEVKKVQEFKYLESTVQSNGECGKESLEEKKGSEEESDANKSEISLVYEIALKRNMPVNFEVLKESGPPHMKSFLTRVTVGEFSAEGEGNSKKLSKKRAAFSILQELKKLPFIPVVEKPKVHYKKRPKTILKAGPEYGQGMNPISRLAQIQQAKREKEPEYTLLSERGLPRRREFIMQNSRHLSPPIPTCLHSLLYLFPTLSITLDC